MAKKRGKRTRKVPKAPRAQKVARKKVTVRAMPAIAKRKERRKKKERKTGRAIAEKRRRRRNAILSAFFIIAFVVFIKAFFDQDWYSVAIAFFAMFLSLAIFKRKKKKKEKKSLKARARIVYGLFLIIWLAAVALAVLSIVGKKYLYAIIAFCAMFFCSFITAIVHKNLKKIEAVTAMRKMLQRKSKRYETNFDKLLALLKKYKKLKVSHISKGFGVSKEKVMEWSEILESHNFLKVRYPPFAEAELVTKGGAKKGATK